MTKRITILATGACLAAFVAAACGGGNDDASEASADAAQSPAADTAAPIETPDDAAARDAPADDADDAAPRAEAPPRPTEPAQVTEAPAEQAAPPAEPAAATAPAEAPTVDEPAASEDEVEPAVEADTTAPAVDSAALTGDEIVTTPSLFDQPDPGVTVAEVPDRPDAFADFGSTLVPWIQGRTTIDALLPLSSAWALPRVADGSRWNLADTNRDAIQPGDGRSSIVLVFTDPATGGAPDVGSNLVIYDPLPDSPGVFRIAYDHNAVKQLRGETASSLNIIVRSVEDVNGDARRDISFDELLCDDAGCTTTAYVLSSEGNGYRRTLGDG